MAGIPETESYPVTERSKWWDNKIPTKNKQTWIFGITINLLKVFKIQNIA